MALAGSVEWDAHVPFAGDKSLRYGVPPPLWTPAFAGVASREAVFIVIGAYILFENFNGTTFRPIMAWRGAH